MKENDFGPHEEHLFPPGKVLFRKVFNDMRVSNWKIVPDIGTTDFSDLQDYLEHEYGENPMLKRTTFRADIIEDSESFQYVGVTDIPEDI